ncbi:hypothetical protein PInf_001520 [Phytophthora infestans]|nr:hypothetical protein PInf_001520 [Phytophthora infestans]
MAGARASNPGAAIMLRSTLYVVVLDSQISVTIVLLDTALQEVRKFKLKKVVIWDPPSGLVRDEVRRLFEIEIAERKLSLSSAMVFCRLNTQETTSK